MQIDSISLKAILHELALRAAQGCVAAGCTAASEKKPTEKYRFSIDFMIQKGSTSPGLKTTAHSISEDLIPRSLLRDVSCYYLRASILQLVLIMSTYIHKSHNVLVFIYRFVFPAKYRTAIFGEDVDQELRDICLGIAQRYEIIFLEIGVDRDHAHFLVQSVPTYRPKKIVQIIKSLTARYIFKRIPAVKSQLWGGEFWSDGYFVSTVGKHGDEDVISHDVKRQGQPDNGYQQLHYQAQQGSSDQLCLW